MPTASVTWNVRGLSGRNRPSPLTCGEIKDSASLSNRLSTFTRNRTSLTGPIDYRNLGFFNAGWYGQSRRLLGNLRWRF